MSKKHQIKNLAVFIGLKAAHEILIKYTNKPESIPHLNQEADSYFDLSFDLAKGNWNKEDIKIIRELSKKRCNKKLKKYKDIGNEKYNEVDDVINNIMVELELI